jgi:hypothetical protein
MIEEPTYIRLARKEKEYCEQEEKKFENLKKHLYDRRTNDPLSR